jgi:hypothetical protein
MGFHLPLHIQMNPVLDTIGVISIHARERTGLTAKAQLLNMDGSVLWLKSLDLIYK